MKARSRILPISTQHREFTVRVAGEEVSRSEHLLSASISTQVNKIAFARLVYQDGNPATGNFELLDSGLFSSGAEIEILAGASSEQTLIFKGIVVAHQIRVSESAAATLMITCKHAVVAATMRNQGQYFEQQTDLDVVSSLLGQYNLNTQSTDELPTHPLLVKYQASDWEFCLGRLIANGLMVYTQPEQLLISTGESSEPAVCTLTFGATVLAADLGSDARHHYQTYSATFWDADNQTAETRSGTGEYSPVPGNITHDALAESIGGHEAKLAPAAELVDETQSWANGQQAYAQGSVVSGSIKTVGMAEVQAGDSITLAGFGDSLDGEARVTGVRHELDTVQGWRSYFQIGGLQHHKGGALPSLPTVAGMMIGVVVSNDDPDQAARVKVRIPLLDSEVDGVWARVASLDAGNDRGLLVRPEIDDEVLVGFIQDDPRKAVILGMLHSVAKPAPAEPSDDNHIKLWKTRSGMQIEFDDDLIAMTFNTPGGNEVQLSEEQGALTLVDQHGNQIVMNDAGIEINSASDLNLQAAGDISIEGNNLNLNGQAQVTTEGGAGVTIKSSAITTIEGSLVKLN